MQRMKHLSNYQLYPLFTCWLGIRQRCTDPRHKAFPDYGGRGIKMCERWANSVDAFVADMGPRAPGLSIERKDVNGHYEPGNCCWATREQQARNKRNTKLTDDDVAEILAAVQSGVPPAHITLWYPISAAHVRMLVRGQRRVLDGVEYPAPNESPHAKRLTPEQVAAIRAEHAAGAIVKDLAARYGVHRNSVHRLLNGTSWNHTTERHPSSSR